MEDVRYAEAGDGTSIASRVLDGTEPAASLDLVMVSGGVIGARDERPAGTGEVWVTGSVVVATAGQAIAFEPVGKHELKGVPGSWELFRVVGQSSAA